MYVIKGGIGTRHSPSYRMNRPAGLENPVLLILRSYAEYTVGGKDYVMEPGYAMVITPRVPYSYHNPGGEYIDDWLHIGLKEGESLPEDLPANVPIRLTDHETCSSLIRLLLWEEAYSARDYVAANTDALFRVLINHLLAAAREEDRFDEANPYMEQLKDIRFRMQHTLIEKHSIKTHAEELGISESHFQHLYASLFGIPFQQDLIRMKIANAKFALQTTDLSMAEIAELCGYNSEVHFFRQFKQINGITPARYRKQQYAIMKPGEEDRKQR